MYCGMLGRDGEFSALSISSPCPSQRPYFGSIVTRSEVHMVNGESTSANDQEIQNVLFEEIRDRSDPLYTSFRKYITYLDKRRPCGPIPFDAR